MEHEPGIIDVVTFYWPFVRIVSRPIVWLVQNSSVPLAGLILFLFVYVFVNWDGERGEEA